MAQQPNRRTATAATVSRKTSVAIIGRLGAYVDKGHEPIGTDGIYEPGKIGIDGVYKNANPPPDYIVTEVKYESAQLEKGLADGTNQMDDDWVRKRLVGKVGKPEADKILDAMENGSVEKWLVRVSEDGTSKGTKINSSGTPIRGKIGQAF